jgi:hypothetical protein
MTGPELDKIAMEVFDDLSKGGTVDVEERQLIVEPVNTRRFDEKAEMISSRGAGRYTKGNLGFMLEDVEK